MKIALIGNMNNNFSALCRYLLDEGYDAHLFQFASDPPHFEARSDCFDGQLDGRIHIVDWGMPVRLFAFNAQEVKEVLKSFNFIIACGPALAYLNKAGIRTDVFIPYGSDIYYLPLIERSNNLLYFLKRLYFRYFHLRGIREASLLMMEKQSEYVERVIGSLNITGKRHEVSIPMLHAPTYQHVSETDRKSLQYFEIYKRIREENDLVIFHQSRHSWKNPADKVELKGNDILLRGFKQFVEKHPQIKACIVTLEYGAEVQLSKDLIRDLHLNEYVKWLPKQDRKELMIGVTMSDLVVGELYNSYNLYGVIVEGLAAAKPIMQKRKDSDFLGAYNTLHPILYADDEQSVCEGLESLIKDPEAYIRNGRDGRQWYEDNIVSRFLDIIKQEINSKR